MMNHQSRNKPLARTNSAGMQRASRAFLVFSWALVVALACLIFYMSAKSGEALDHGSGIVSLIRNALIAATTSLFGHPVDVSPIGHFTEFFLFGIVLTNALRLSLPLKRAAVSAVIIASVYGVTDELHQIFVPMRSCDPVDWLVDTIAALLGALLFCAILRALRKRKESRTLLS